MNIPAAIVAGALIIAAAIAFSLRWEIGSSDQALVRLDRWTGQIALCLPEKTSDKPTIRYKCETQ
jgi:hypothetical protein